VTFTLDAATIARLCATAERLSLPESQVVREAIRDFGDRAERLSERERQRSRPAPSVVDTSVLIDALTAVAVARSTWRSPRAP
jgi:hypothetical protein